MPNIKIYNGIVLDGWSMSFAQIFGSGPLLTIKCGSCGCRFDKRVRPAHRPTVRCTICGAANKLDITV